ncbi:MAG: O-antigen ligase family protein [Balneolaceae bacterium]
MQNQSHFLIVFAFLITGFVFFPVVQKFWGVSSIYDHQRLANIFLLIVTTLTFLINKTLQHQWIKTWNKLPGFIRSGLFFILITGLILTLFSPYPIWALVDIGQFMLFFVLIIVTATIVSQYNIILKKILLMLVVAFAFLFLFQTVSSFIHSYTITYPELPRTDTLIGAYSFSHIRFFNQIQTITLPLLGVAVIYSTKINKTATAITFVLLCGWWLLVFISGARGTLLSASAGIVIAGFLIYRYKSDWFKVQFFSFLTGAAVYLLFFSSVEAEGTGRALTREGVGRLVYWEKTISGILEKPILGYGAMQSSIEGLGLHGHNYFLTISYEWGLPIALLITAILGYSLYKFYIKIKEVEESGDKLQKVFHTGLLASLIAIWIHSLFSDLFKTPIAQIWIVLCIGYAIGIYYQSKEYLETKPAYNWKFSALVTATLFIFLWSVYPSASSYKERQTEYVEQYNPPHFRPRFWHQGKIGWSDKQKNQEIIDKYNNQ